MLPIILLNEMIVMIKPKYMLELIGMTLFTALMVALLIIYIYVSPFIGFVFVSVFTGIIAWFWNKIDNIRRGWE